MGKTRPTPQRYFRASNQIAGAVKSKGRHGNRRCEDLEIPHAMRFPKEDTKTTDVKNRKFRMEVFIPSLTNKGTCEAW